jgi:hypothetical protein
VYSVGDYLVHPDCYKHGQYGDLGLGRMKLWPLGVALKECGVTPPLAVKAA